MFSTGVMSPVLDRDVQSSMGTAPHDGGCQALSASRVVHTSCQPPTSSCIPTARSSPLVPRWRPANRPRKHAQPSPVAPLGTVHEGDRHDGSPRADRRGYLAVDVDAPRSLRRTQDPRTIGQLGQQRRPMETSSSHEGAIPDARNDPAHLEEHADSPKRAAHGHPGRRGTKPGEGELAVRPWAARCRTSSLTQGFAARKSRNGMPRTSKQIGREGAASCSSRRLAVYARRGPMRCTPGL